MLITRPAYYFCCTNIFALILLFLLAANCDARKSSSSSSSAAHIFRAFPHSRNSNINVIKRLDVMGIIGNHVLLDSSNSQPYYGYSSPSSPLSLPPFESLPPMPMPENTVPPSVCLYPPSTPSTTIPSPIGFGGGSSGGVGYDSPPPPPASSSSSNPPILPIGGGSSPSLPSPPAVYAPILPNPPTGSSGGGYVPISPIEPILSPPPPFTYEPSPPSSSIPSTSPPFSYPSTPAGGFVPISPPVTVFQPPVVYPPPTGRPPRSPTTALWCVAKPAVPDPIVQEAMNYACGSGADCDSLQASGSCFQPNTLFAHASYAFNSYWQRTKVAGGTCEFGGSAILVTVDPSYDGCHFMYN